MQQTWSSNPTFILVTVEQPASSMNTPFLTEPRSHVDFYSNYVLNPEVGAQWSGRWKWWRCLNTVWSCARNKQAGLHPNLTQLACENSKCNSNEERVVFVMTFDLSLLFCAHLYKTSPALQPLLNQTLTTKNNHKEFQLFSHIKNVSLQHFFTWLNF